MTSKKAESSFIEKEREVRLLRNSKLIAYDEYKTMLRIIECHYDEIKQSAFYKKKRENDMRPFFYDHGDTYEKPFFSVLIKMLTEVNGMLNINKQIEDLHRVYQWYLTNKQQLCKTEQVFRDVENSNEVSRLLQQRPSSSAGPGNRSGILRHDRIFIETNENARPHTSNPSSRNGLYRKTQEMDLEDSMIDTGILRVKGMDSVNAPEIPVDLKDYKYVSIATSPRLLKRPDTAPPMVMLDPQPLHEISNSVSKQKSKELKNQEKLSTGLQSQVSKVSIHYNRKNTMKKALHIHLPNGESQSEVEFCQNEVKTRSHHRSKSADCLVGGVLLNPDNDRADSQSELDEDRVVLDPEAFFLEADINDTKDVISYAEQLTGKTKEQSQNRHEMESNFCLQESDHVSDVSKGSLHEIQNDVIPSSPSEKIIEDGKDSKQVEYISSYSKFQKIRNHRNTVVPNPKDLKQHQEKGSNINKSVYQCLLENSRSLGNLPADRSTKNCVSTAAVLELATPIGQQMLEQKAPNEMSQGFLRGFEKRYHLSTNSPRDRPSPRLHLRNEAAIKTYPSSHSLRKAEISLKPENSPRQYTVHFPKKAAGSTVKHYKVSGPVQPNSQRYQYTDDGFGSKTYVKRLARSQKSCDTGRKVKQPKKVTQSSETILLGSKSPYMNTKSLTSLMIVRHLGGADRRSSERMSGKSNAVPVWVAAQDALYQSYDELEYLKLTRPFHEDSGVELGNVPEQRPDYHVKEIEIDFPNVLHVDKEIKERHHHVNGYSKPAKNIFPPKHLHDTLEDCQGYSSMGEIEQYNGGFYPLQAHGHALRGMQVGNKTKLYPDGRGGRFAEDPRDKLTNRQFSRPSSSARPINRPISACSKTPSRVSSADSSRRSRSAIRQKAPNEQSAFDVKNFSHYCFDDHPELQEDYQYQKNVNAAVDIQRIFRGYMARKYMQHLKSSEKERERKAAVTLQSAMRGFLTRKRMIKENVRRRTPAVNTVEWAKQYREELKKRDNERSIKVNTRNKKISKLKTEQEGKLKRINATSTIYDIFHDKGPTKSQMKAAAITIQRYFRGWLVRRYFKKAKEKAMKRTLNFNGFLKSYRLHLERITKQHGVKDARPTINFDEVLDYIDKRNKYDIEYDRIARAQSGVFTYEDIKKFFEACGHHPSRAEVGQAIKLALEDVVEVKQHKFTKTEMAEVAFHIYVPKGTKLADTRKSTWLNPLVNGDEAARVKLTKKINEETNLNKVFSLFTQSKNGPIENDNQLTNINPDTKVIDKVKVQQIKHLSKSKK